MPDNVVVGKIGRVTARIAPGCDGEVMVSIRGGSEAFIAHADSVFERGAKVQVTEHFPPRVVCVAAPKE